MSTLSPIDDVERAVRGVSDNWKARADSFDDRIVKPTRATQPPGVSDQRGVQRLSIGELNDLDADEIRDRLQRTGFDNRGPVTKFLDLIDAPRNAIVSHIWPEVERQKRESGEVGAFGAGKVYVSDVLHHAGVRPGIVSGVLGFLGDVAFDPLTYIGPAGWGTKIATKGGRAVELGAQFTRAAKRSIAEVATGGPKDQYFRKVWEAIGRPTDGSALSEAVLGKRTTKSVLSRVGEAVGLRDEARAGGIADDVYRVAEGPDAARIAAQKDLYARYGIGAPGAEGGVRLTPKGLAFGNGQSQIAHIPFTELGVYVPGFTQSAKLNLARKSLGMVKGGAFRPAQALGEVENLTREMDDLQKLHAGLAEDLGNAFDDETKANIGGQMQQARAQMDDVLNRMHTTVKNGEWGAADLPTLLHLGERVDASNKLIAMNQAKFEASPLYDLLARRVAEIRSTKGGDQIAGLADPFVAKKYKSDLIESSRIAALDDPAVQKINQQINEGRAAGIDTEPWESIRDGMIDRIAESRRAERLQDFQKTIVSMADEDLDKASALADAHIKNMQAAYAYSNAVHAPLYSTMTTGERLVADAASELLGVSSDYLGPSIFAGPRSAAHSLFNENRALSFEAAMERLQSGGRKVFGNRRSYYNQWRRKAEDVLTNGPTFETAAHTEPMLNDFNKIASDFKVPRSKTEVLANLLDVRIWQKLAADFPNEVALQQLDRATGQMVDNALARSLREAKAGGMLDPGVAAGQYDGLLKRIDELADQHIAEYRRLGQAGTDEGVLGRTIRPYSPNLFTPEMARQAVAQRKAPGDLARTAEGTGSINAAAESFQKPRTSLVYHFSTLGEDGKPVYHELTERDFDIATIYKAGIPAQSQMDNQSRKAIETAIEEVAAFNKTYPGLSEDARRQLLGKIMDPRTLNDAMRDRYLPITGGAPIAGQMFETNGVRSLMARVGQQYRAQAKASFSPIMEKLALSTDQQIASSERLGPRGSKFRLTNGVEGTVLGDGKIKVGDVTYRQIDRSKIPTDETSLFHGIMEDAHLAQFYPEQVAEFVERMAETGAGDDLHAMLKFADQAIKTWKTLTLAHPSWPLFNVAGLAWNMMVGRVDPVATAKYLKDAAKIRMAGGRLSRLGGQSVELAGQKANLADISKDTHLFNVGTPPSREAYESVQPSGGVRLGAEMGAPRERGDFAREAAQGIKSEFDRQVEQLVLSRANQQAATPMDKLAIGAKVLYNEGFMRKVFAPFMAANAFMEDTIRTAGYMALLDKGFTPAEAAAKVRETFYDMGDLTGTEKWVRRWMIPFFAWMRSNTAYQMRTVMQNPKIAGALPKLKEAVEEATAGDEVLPDHQRPNWMREQMAIQIGKGGENRLGITVGTALPGEPINQLGGAVAGGSEGVQNLVKWFTSGLAPPWAVPLQIGAGREFFTNKSIGAGDTGDVSPSEFALGQIRPLRELAPIGPRVPPLIRAAREGIVPFVSRVVLGGRSQSLSDDRSAQLVKREFDDRMDALRKRIRVAEANGNHEESLRARVRLLAVQREARKANVKIPRYAERFLDQPAAR